jgi:hypothetical protein
MICYQENTAEGTPLSDWDRFTSLFDGQAVSPLQKWYLSLHALTFWSNLHFAWMTFSILMGCLPMNSC